MKINEYELVIKNNKIKLNIAKSFNENINSINDALCFIMDLYDLPNSAIEKSFVLSYDSKGKFKGFIQIGIGDFKGVQFPLSTTFKFLLLDNAYGCIFAHNHIKGCKLSPSNDDYLFHANADTLCNILNIEMFANVILQDWECYYDIKTGKRKELI